MADEELPVSPTRIAVDVAKKAIEHHRETLFHEQEGQPVPDALTASCCIDLSSLGLTRLPEALADVLRDEVNVLRLDHNDLASLSALGVRLHEFSKLRYLSLRHNNLTEFPPELLDLPNLEVLDLKDNLLTSLPEDLSRLARLKKLTVKDNQITRIPACISTMHSLSVLSASGNPIVFPEPDKWLVDNPSPSGDYAMGALDQQATARVKKLLVQHAKGEKLRNDTDSATQSESNAESTPRPTRRQTSGRFPIKPSTSSIDMNNMVLSNSPRVHAKPPALALSKHTRVPTGPRSAVLRPAIAPLAANNSERNRSNSESQTYSTIREKRRGVIHPKAGSDQARLDVQKANRLSHMRGISYPSNLQNGTMAYANTDESSPPSPVDTEPARGAFVSRLSSLPEKRRKSQFYDSRVELAHGVDFVLCQLRFPLEYLKTTIKDGASRGKLFERAYHSVYGHLDELRRQLQHVEIDSEDAEEVEQPDVLDRIYHWCQMCLRGFEQLLETLHQQVSLIVREANASYVRSLMLLLYGGMIELRNVTSKHNIEQQRTPAAKPYNLSNESNQIRSVSSRHSPMHSHTISRNQSIDSGQERPLTSLRVRDKSKQSHRKSSNTRPKPLALHARGMSGSLASLNGFPSRGYEAYNPNQSSEPPGLSRSTTLASADFDDLNEDPIFNSIWHKLSLACEKATGALPRCEMDLNNCRRRNLNDRQAGILDDVSAKCGLTLRSAKALKNRLLVMHRSPNRYRDSPEFWHLCLNLSSAQAAFVEALRLSIHEGLVPNSVKMGVRPVHESIKAASAAIYISPWRRYTTSTNRKPSTVTPAVESAYTSPLMTAISGASGAHTSQSTWGPDSSTGSLPPAPLQTTMTMKPLPSLGLNTKAYVPPPNPADPQSAVSSNSAAAGVHSGSATPLPATPLTASLGPAAAATVPTVSKAALGMPMSMGNPGVLNVIGGSTPNISSMLNHALPDGVGPNRQLLRTGSISRKLPWTSLNL